MAFVATCIEATARALGVGYKEVYDRMERVNMIDVYMVAGWRLFTRDKLRRFAPILPLSHLLN